MKSNIYTRVFTVLAAAMIICSTVIGAYAAAPVSKQTTSAMVNRCKADLAKRLKIQPQAVTIAKTESVVWPDASLGMPEAGKMYAQVMTPGLRVILSAKNNTYIYTTSEKSIKYGGPVATWACSMLYTKPVKNEPNLNSDLYQSSLIGTNHVRLISGISEYFPQDNGVIFATRRTSRSSFDLVYFNAKDAENVRTVYSSFYIGEAASNSDQTEWAAFMRPSVGSAWMIAVDNIAQDDTEARRLALPNGVTPHSIAWTEEGIIILVKKGDKTIAYTTSPKAGLTEWKETKVYNFPETVSYMLNKSETLEIEQITVNGKPAVDIAKVWFNGDRRDVAKIENLTLKGYDFLMSRYVLVWGERNSIPVAYTVDIATDEVIQAAKGIGDNIKAFRYHPSTTPFGEI